MNKAEPRVVMIIYRCIAAKAAANPTTRMLPPRLSGFPAMSLLVGKGVTGPVIGSFHRRKTAFISLGAPSSTTVLTGINGRSSTEAARMT